MAGDWTEAELKTHIRRTQLLQQQEGIHENQANQLADAMQSRDRDLPQDDRRICPECRKWQNRKCTEGRKPLPYILQRHDCIEVRGSHQAAHSR